MAHGDAVVHGDGVELLGDAAGRLDFTGHQLAQVLQVHVAGHELGEGKVSSPIIRLHEERLKGCRTEEGNHEGLAGRCIPDGAGGIDLWSSRVLAGHRSRAWARWPMPARRWLPACPELVLLDLHRRRARLPA